MSACLGDLQGPGAPWVLGDGGPRCSSGQGLGDRICPTPWPGAGQLGDTRDSHSLGIRHLQGDRDRPRLGWNLGSWVDATRCSPWPDRTAELKIGPAVAFLAQRLTTWGGWDGVLGHGVSSKEAGKSQSGLMVPSVPLQYSRFLFFFSLCATATFRRLLILAHWVPLVCSYLLGEYLSPCSFRCFVLHISIPQCPFELLS